MWKNAKVHFIKLLKWESEKTNNVRFLKILPTLTSRYKAKTPQGIEPRPENQECHHRSLLLFLLTRTKSKTWRNKIVPPGKGKTWHLLFYPSRLPEWPETTKRNTAGFPIPCTIPNIYFSSNDQRDQFFLDDSSYYFSNGHLSLCFTSET